MHVIYKDRDAINQFNQSCVITQKKWVQFKVQPVLMETSTFGHVAPVQI